MLALGKLGAGELNYSSDIDLILLHDPIVNPLTDTETSQTTYVGMTRAKRNLTISFVSTRYVYGQTISSIPSRFIDELPPEHVTAVDASGPGYGRQNMQAADTAQPGFAARPAAYTTGTANPNRHPEFSASDRVFHDKFGYGRIVQIKGEQLKIVFDHTGLKTVLADYVTKKA